VFKPIGARYASDRTTLRGEVLEFATSTPIGDVAVSTSMFW